MLRERHVSRSAPLVLCAAIALALPGCTTKSEQASQTIPQQPLPTASEDRELGEVALTGSKLERLHKQMPSGVMATKEIAQSYSNDVAATGLYYRHRELALNLPAVNTEKYAQIERNPIKLTREEPVSTFSIDVDTGAYANVRRFLNNDRLPPQDAVRVEELINYFTYDYPQPDSETPFSVSTELSANPWNSDTWLLQVGLKGFEVPAAERPSANLVFLLDVSGSMNDPDKLPLLKKSFKLLTQQLDDNDRISIVVYAGASGVVLEPTPGNEHGIIKKALRKLEAGGSTNGAEGIQLAYEIAEEAFIENGINRIVLATDGDFNVGTVNFEALKDLAERKRETGISLTTLGFGTGNYNDHLMEQLADAGNGNYAYIDSAKEARKVLVNEVTSTLHTIAKDVKIQIEFNPDIVAEYRLIGYENRMLNREDFTNDKVDAGEIGAGHTVTALYELVPAASTSRSVIPLRYQSETATSARPGALSGEAAFVRLRYKQPDGDVSTEITTPVRTADRVELENSSDNLRFSASVAAFGQLLNGSPHIGDFSMKDVNALAQSAITADPYGYRHEFVSLVSAADSLMTESTGGPVALTN
ncbi:MAG: von Willebrand factor type A domain-containing protein [Gammaproteobacteria bacterium]